jgi:hypothetical protein
MSMSGVKAVAGEIEHFIDCVQSGREPLTDGPQSLQGLRVIWRLYEAEERGVVADLRGLGFRNALPPDPGLPAPDGSREL